MERKPTYEELENEILSLRKKGKDIAQRYLDIAGVIFVAIDTNGTITLINKKGCEVLGYDHEEVIGKNWFEKFLPDKDKKNVAGVFSQIISGDLEPMKYYENTVLSKSGQEKIIHWHNSLITDKHGNIQGTLSSGEDITERKLAEEARKKSEENYMALFNVSGDGILVAELSTMKFIEANPAICKMLGFSREELLTKGVGDIHPADSLDYVINEFKVQAEGKKLVAQNIPCLTKNGAVIYVDISTTKGEIYGKECNIGLFRDITEFKQLQAQLMQSQKMESIGTLAGGIAHDFNNMLSIIMGNISMAMQDLRQNDERYRLLQNVQNGANQAQNLTHQLLTFAKGGEPIKMATNLNQLITETVQFVTRGASSKCELNLADDLSVVEVDKGQINQAISNIIINAIQAMPEGGVIKVKTRNIALGIGNNIPLPPGSFVHIQIEDQGIGISDKIIAKIFDPFFTTKQKGSGIGLATTYSIIKKHEGHITVSSELGEGTVFSIFLPSSSKYTEEIKVQGQVRHHGQGKVLIMDDQEQIIDVLKTMLKSMGYEVFKSSDGAQAIEIYRDALQSQIPFDFVILDLTVPGGMGGIRTVIELLKIDPNVKAIVSSGYSNDPIMANYQDYGFCGVAPKPYTKEQLSEVLNNVLDKKN